jgi:outer membrane protein OmpA-like peptidoglycan-associated protein
MARVAEVRASPAAAEAEQWAPQAHGRALALEERAERAMRDGDAEAAELLAEQAIAAHEHAWVLTRLARAERRRLEAEKQLDEQRRTLSELRAQHQRLAAEATALELRAQVVRAALPLPPHEAAPPDRQQARRQAAAALATQARLLCVAARLLGQAQGVSPILTRLDELDRELAAGGSSRQLELATQLRSECLRVISEARRQNSAPAARAPGAPPVPREQAVAAGASSTRPATTAPVPADVVLDELSATGAAPSRDDRGVAVSLRNVLGADGNLTDGARLELRRIAQIAAAHPDFPVLLVAHGASPRADGDPQRELAAVSSALAGAGVSRLEVQSVGDRSPLLPSSSPSARERNQRIELIFVAPGF